MKTIEHTEEDPLVTTHPSIPDLRARYRVQQAVEKRRADVHLEEIFAKYLLPELRANADAGIPQIRLGIQTVRDMGVTPTRFFAWLQEVGFRVLTDQCDEGVVYITFLSGGI